VGSVHGSWTIGTLVHSGPVSIASRWSSPEPNLRPLWGSGPTTKGWGRGVEHGGSIGPFTRGWVGVSRPSNGERWWGSKADGGGMLQCETGGKGGDVGHGEVRGGWGALL
jgi:hypothetical protein